MNAGGVYPPTANEMESWDRRMGNLLDFFYVLSPLRWKPEGGESKSESRLSSWHHYVGGGTHGNPKAGECWYILDTPLRRNVSVHAVLLTRGETWPVHSCRWSSLSSLWEFMSDSRHLRKADFREGSPVTPASCYSSPCVTPFPGVWTGTWRLTSIKQNIAKAMGVASVIRLQETVTSVLPEDSLSGFAGTKCHVGNPQLHAGCCTARSCGWPPANSEQTLCPTALEKRNLTNTHCRA